MEGPIFGGTYMRRGGICVNKSIGLAYTWKANLKKLYVTVPFAFLILPLRAISKYKQPEGHIQGGDVTEGFLCFEFRGPVVGGAHS